MGHGAAESKATREIGGRGDIDRVPAAAKLAQLHEFVEQLSQGDDTSIGERGIRLCGGQRQRLGIARAIYKGAPVLFLDEATSALDEGTEQIVMQALRQLQAQGRTIMMIAHRPSTIRQCDLVVRLENGRIAECGTFDQLFPGRRFA